MPADGDFPGHPDECITAAGAGADVDAAHCAWEKVSARKKADRAAILRQWPEWQLEQEVSNSVLDVSQLPTSRLTPREREIVHHDATALVQALRERQYTATEVIKAFCHVATIAQGLTNCLTEVFFAEALNRAVLLMQLLLPDSVSRRPLILR